MFNIFPGGWKVFCFSRGTPQLRVANDTKRWGGRSAHAEGTRDGARVPPPVTEALLPRGTPDHFTKRELIFGFNRAFESRPIPLAARSLCNFIE